MWDNKVYLDLCDIIRGWFPVFQQFKLSEGVHVRLSEREIAYCLELPQVAGESGWCSLRPLNHSALCNKS